MSCTGRSKSQCRIVLGKLWPAVRKRLRVRRLSPPDETRNRFLSGLHSGDYTTAASKDENGRTMASLYPHSGLVSDTKWLSLISHRELLATMEDRGSGLRR